MGLFDFFSGDDAQKAANAQIAGIQAGQTNATSAINQGSNALATNYGSAVNALVNNFGVGSNALSGNFGAATNALTGTAGAAGGALTNNYTAALLPFLQNYGTAQGGVRQLTDLLGITGSPAGTVGTSPAGGPVPPMMSGAPAGAAGAGPGASVPGTILSTLQNTPGYQFQLQQGDNAINAKAAATGQLDSGNTLLDLSKFNQGLAGTTYQNAVSNLMPFLGQSNTAASGIGSTLTGLGSSLAGNFNNLGGNLANTFTGLGTSLAGNSANLGGALANTYTGLGQGLNANQGSLANLNYTAATGQGNAQANADLANYQASGNIWNTVGNVASAAAKFAPFLLSDERAKDDIEPVGELYDGTGVYRYRYKGDPRFQIGVMAQEVEATRPEAITEIGGLKHVDYAKATDLAASLAKFVDDGDNVVKLDDFRVKPASAVDMLSRFLEAA